MKSARIRLITAVSLMAAWLTFLGYLALGKSQPVVVSRSQIIQATHYVKAEIAVNSQNQPETAVRVLESFGGKPIPAEKIEVANLADARLPDGKPITVSGNYFLPLIANGPNYRVAPAATQRNNELPTRFVAYPWTTEVEHQVRELVTKP